MYDVKQFDPKEWTSPPLEGRLVDRPGLGKVLIGRGATNQKGPESAMLAALHGLKAAGKKPPVNLVLVCEGEEEIGSPHFTQVVRRPDGIGVIVFERGDERRKRAELPQAPEAFERREGTARQRLVQALHGEIPGGQSHDPVHVSQSREGVG